MNEYPVDEIALRMTNDLDRVYPPMKWTTKWSSGGNIPFTSGVPREFIQGLRNHGFDIPDFYRPGLWAFSDEGHGELIPWGEEKYAGLTCKAWTRWEAIERFHAMVTQ